MRIVVCLAPVAPGTPPTALPAHDAHAVEAALRIADAERSEGRATELTIAGCAPMESLGVVRGALAMGMQRGVLVETAPGEEDVVGQAAAMADWLRDQSPDLVLSCPWSGDIGGTLFVTATAAAAELPVLTGARQLRLDRVGDDTVTASIDRQTEDGDETVTAVLPCVVEVAETINQARYPTVKGRARAQNLPIDLVRSPAAGARVSVGAATPVTADRDTVVIDDPAAAVDAIVEFLREREIV